MPHRGLHGRPARAGTRTRRRSGRHGPRQRGARHVRGLAVELPDAARAREEKCALVQSVTAEDRPNVGLTVVFYKAIGEDKKLLRVVVPLGVLLPTGLGLKIDGEDVGNAPFLKCGKRGCVAEVVLQDEVIAKLKKGENAIFIVFDTPEAGIGIPVSLQGFTNAFSELK
ncbi:hypothetical protein AUC68_14475 [Methyloceanibacter methanicus]|uniref:Invasion associated locus B family protein n=1 Tax=Methyloceanibacter methanicus TaxID=1774968 RepID=A0A1E3W4N9_9HYPH|nr:invasion associated locus B family protein [Methyloceanibacter methanicus]ODS00773.1 hypothetical protein AUC68_14475 [Methyloceanibacter methanicus]